MVGSGSERKVVTALFCDLVGFTSMSESADPEDVDRILGGYFAMARREIERHGGTVEKFIGDAVVGIFGAPVTHEDDAVRAVRAGLGIAGAAADLPGAGDGQLQLRVGINTGEALVRTDVRPESGEGMVVGDAINTAARIQSVAPVNGVGVGLTTWELTRLAIEYEELPPATLKGKAEPVRVFAASAARTALGMDTSRSHAGGYVGRERELGQLRSAFDRVVAGTGARFVAIEGEAGIGKSRLLAELQTHLANASPGVLWRQGRCLPYGEGVTFWALGEIVKAEAGILEDDDPELVASKVVGATDRFDQVDRAWLRDRLLSLLGVATVATGREEQFAAWRSFLEGLAATAPAVIVLEDIHWADEGLVAFLDGLVKSRTTSRLLVLVTTRRVASGSHDLPGFERIPLEPLSGAETERLVVDLLGAALPEGVQRTVVDRAQGNPLFAEEFVRLLVDRDLLDRHDGVISLRSGATVPLPDSITTLLAARLDTLPPERKAVLADAAVVGSVFWTGAVQAVSGQGASQVSGHLDELAAVQLIRPNPDSSMADEREFAFWHALARDVAYAQLPRAERATRHVAAARWIEGKARARVDEVVELLAHHYATAHDLATATGDAERVAELRPLAATYLRRAGERAATLDPAAGIPLYRRALALLADDDSQRPNILVALADVVDQTADHSAAVALFDAAIAAFREQGNELGAARSAVRLRIVLHILNDDRAYHVADGAFAYLTTLPPGPDLVYGLMEQGVDEQAVGKNAEALMTFDRALAVAREVGIDPPPRLLRFRGATRVRLGDAGGFEDFERGIRLAKDEGLSYEAGVSSAWYASYLFLVHGQRRAAPALEEALAYARARSITSAEHQLQAGLMWASIDIGDLDRAVAIARDLLPGVLASGEMTLAAMCTAAMLQAHTLRGELAELPPLLDSYDDNWLTPDELDEWPMCTVMVASAKWALGRRDDAAAALEALANMDERFRDANYRHAIGEAVRIAVEADLLPLAERLTDRVEAFYPSERCAVRLARAWLAEAHGDLASASADFDESARGFDELLTLPSAAIAWLGVGRTRLAMGEPAAARAALDRARSTFEILGAAPWLEKCDALARDVASAGASP